MGNVPAHVLTGAAADSEWRTPLPPPAGLLDVMAGLLETRLDPNDLGNRDVAFMRAVAPYVYSVGLRYFRAEAEGTEHIPETGQFLAVGNHGGVPLLPDVFIL